MISRMFRLAFAAAMLCLLALPALGQDDEPTIEVIELSGPLDGRLVDFAVRSIEEAATRPVEVVILEIDSPGATAELGDLRRLADLVADPPVPVVAWIGPAPARAGGGVAQVVNLAPLRAAAPGAEIAYWQPTIAGRPDSPLISEPSDPEVLDGVIEVDAPVDGMIDLARRETATIRQLAQVLDGMEVGGEVLSTVRPFVDGASGTEGVTVLTTVIRQPGLWDQFLRLAATPEAAFFFLVVGLTVAAFEFYAIGPGIAAGVAALSLLIGGYGLAVLPVRWWAAGLAVASVLVLSMSYQLGGSFVLSAVGLAVLTFSGFAFTDTAPQFPPGAPGVLLTVAAAAFFFLLAMPTVARSRFSTQTIGREGLIGRQGTAVGALDPDGQVEVSGARWQATSHREAGIGGGDAVVVTGIDGWFLEVEPLLVPSEEAPPESDRPAPDRPDLDSTARHGSKGRENQS